MTPTSGCKACSDVADPLLALAFNRVGDRALAGLREVLAHPRTVDAAA
jgi:hypothetical protein